jgi:hypothetical protein
VIWLPAAHNAARKEISLVLSDLLTRIVAGRKRRSVAQSVRKTPPILGCVLSPLGFSSDAQD